MKFAIISVYALNPLGEGSEENLTQIEWAIEESIKEHQQEKEEIIRQREEKERIKQEKKRVEVPPATQDLLEKRKTRKIADARIASNCKLFLLTVILILGAYYLFNRNSKTKQNS